MDYDRCGYCGCEIIKKRFGAKYCSAKCRVYASRRRKENSKRDLEAKPLIDDIRKLLCLLYNLQPGSLDKGQKLFVKECRHASIMYLQYQIDNS